VSFRKHTRVRLGERRREAKLSCQRILEQMDFERALEKHRVANANSEDEDDATLH
jgi:chromosome condensin MukBEF MukE localization factor